MRTQSSRVFFILALIATIISPRLELRAGQVVTVPVGTLIPLRMDTHLTSGTAKVGDPFSATVIDAVEVDDAGALSPDDQHMHFAIPAGSKIEGHVRMVNRAERMSRAGIIGVAFDRLVFPNNASVRVEGTLTSIERAAGSEAGIDEGDRVEGSSQARRATVFIGAGAGVGAIVGAITHGGKGAAVGAGAGAVAGTLGVLLAKGGEAEVRPGTEFAMRVERRFAIDTSAVEVPDSRPAYQDSRKDLMWISATFYLGREAEGVATFNYWRAIY